MLGGVSCGCGSVDDKGSVGGIVTSGDVGGVDCGSDYGCDPGDSASPVAFAVFAILPIGDVAVAVTVALSGLQYVDCREIYEGDFEGDICMAGGAGSGIGGVGNVGVIEDSCVSTLITIHDSHF
ncbi:Hypothetical predicted protein [Octopus vulgaris]|uniref:Uncharacterized protein n=1 Tax=Octopus vulgaris TaxID=6645 RepID=A0AA36BZY3_OCTVU|nr:Hypothetical predicted protein [Octopus vulgaris]